MQWSMLQEPIIRQVSLLIRRNRSLIGSSNTIFYERHGAT